MHINITPLSYKAINEVLINAKQSVPAKGIWLELHSEYNIGKREGESINLNAKSRIHIANIVKELIGLDPRVDHYHELTQMSRTQISKRTRKEKFISLPPREAFVEVRILNQDDCDAGYQGMIVKDALAIEKKCIISVENFDTFANIQKSNLECVSDIAGDTLFIVFAGDNIANPKAVQELKQKSDALWVHYGDYDPAGIHISLVRLKADRLIVPSLKAKQSLLEMSNPELFAQQSVQLHHVLPFTQHGIAEHIAFMKDNRVAVIQEQLTSHQIPLTLLTIKK